MSDPVYFTTYRYHRCLETATLDLFAYGTAASAKKTFEEEAKTCRERYEHALKCLKEIESSTTTKPS